MADVTVRRWVPEDLDRIAQHSGRSGDEPWDPFSDAEALRQVPLDGLVVAEVNDEYAGFLYWFLGRRPWFDREADRFAHILEVQVLPSLQGQGVGKALLNHALERLSEESLEAVYVDTTDDNDVARRLYEGAGFDPFLRTIHYRRKVE
ncbi:MAG: GNAT family N-acetyltransferase [Thermoplasmata archaeon]